tara:strand:+ start:204 stop:647 length:444 start_codon:yes stop_codon:yes gene_type:complete
MLFYKTTIKSEIVDKIVETVNKYKFNFEDVSHDTNTEKGFQSPNILNIFDNNLIKEMLDNQCLYQDIFHVHYIEYFDGGFQAIHNHFKSEEYSFILYLNDAVGDTVFSHTAITPKKGLLVIFDSRLDHSGKESINKKILVGAIKKKL